MLLQNFSDSLTNTASYSDGDGLAFGLIAENSLNASFGLWS